MQKKLAADLISIAHRILQMKNKEDVLALKEQAYQVYEKLTLLAYVDEYLATTPNATETKEALVSALENTVSVVADKPVLENITEESIEIEQPFDDIEAAFFGEENLPETKDEQEIGQRKPLSLEDELMDTISLDVAADMFEKVPQNKSINENFQGDLQIGLNDRIAFVNHLFDGSQEDFNRVVSQINTIKTEKEALKFISKMIKPDYTWENKEEYEERFLSIITRKFA